MIGLDTNVVLRYLMQDDEEQSRVVNKLIDGLTPSKRGFISILTIVEIIWFLERRLRRPRAEVFAAIRCLLESDRLTVQHAESIAKALDLDVGAYDIEDAIISQLCKGQGCSTVLSFDKQAIKHLGMQAVEEYVA
jgi:predicted nucleic-acid-binding protein